MSKKTRKKIVKEIPAKKQKRSLKEHFVSSIWSNTVYRLLSKFTLAIVVFYGLWATPFFQETVVAFVAQSYAKIGGFLLGILGYPVQVAGDVIGSEAFSISIRNGCDGIEGLMILLTAIFIFPTGLKDKVQGLLWGSLFLIGLNLFRIISLYWFGIHLPYLFELMHVSIWQVLFILLSLVTLFYWMNWTSKKNKLVKTLNPSNFH